MKENKKVLFICLLAAFVPFAAAIMIEFIFVYGRNGFLQWFLFGFSFFGCGLIALYFFLRYLFARRELFDELKTYFVSFLVYLKDFDVNIGGETEEVEDAYEKLDKIVEYKNRFESVQGGFILKFSVYPKIVKEFNGYVQEYIAMYNKLMPLILGADENAASQAYDQMKSLVSDLRLQGYETISQYAKKLQVYGINKNKWHFEDVKVLIEDEKFGVHN